MPLTVNIIGAGKLGKTIGRLITIHQAATITAVCNKSIESAKAAVAFIGEGQPYADISALPTADLTIISTPDDQASPISSLLSQSEHIHPGNIFIHCSGVLTSDSLFSLKEKGGVVASMHPMKSFAEPDMAITNYSGTYCAMEGDPEALAIIEPIFKAIGSITYQIEKSKKTIYHGAAVFASNYLVTLSQQALQCLIKSGVEENIAVKIVIHLMQGTLDNLENTMSPKKALTGPIARGDINTIKKHLSALSDCQQKTLYSLLGMATLELTSHSEATKDALETALLSAT